MANQLESSDKHSAPVAWDGQNIHLDDIGAALAVCNVDGELLGATASARVILTHFSNPAPGYPQILPAGLWQDLMASPLGEIVQWRPTDWAQDTYLGCTRYRLGDQHALLVMRVLRDRSTILSKRLHEQRLEATGRLVANIAHELRTPLSSILFNADFMALRWDQLPPDLALESLKEIQTACRRMQRTIEGLLDFARLGVQRTSSVSLRESFERTTSLLRPTFRDGGHTIQVNIRPGAEWVRGNPLVLEQIFVNLMMNAIESDRRGVRIEVESSREVYQVLDPSQEFVCVRVRDTGSGVAAEIRNRIFEPFFTTKPNNVGLGLTMAREAIHDFGGDIVVEPTVGGACFAVYLKPCLPDKATGETL